MHRFASLMLYLFISGVFAGMGQVACTPRASEESGLTSADFGAPADVEDHDHADHDHGAEAGSPEGNPSVTEPDEEGAFIDHHGNRIVDELYQRFEQDGRLLEFTVENFLGVGGRGGEVSADLRAGERALIKFRISDVQSGEVLAGLRPLAWVDSQTVEHTEEDPEEQEALCRKKVEGYLSGGLTARPTIDLNGFFILALNEDASISVIDPTVDVSGMTQLFALIQLAGSGEDWLLRDDQEELWVTIPSRNQVAVASLDDFALAQHLDSGPNPSRVILQPDQRYLWVANDVDQGDGGVTVFDPQTRQVVTSITTGAGHHDLAFSADSRYAFVTNSLDGTLSVIDIDTLTEIEDVEVGRTPVTLAVSSLTGAIYVADAATGDVTVLDGQRFTRVTEVRTDPGTEALAFTPDGRWIFLTNPVASKIYLMDVGSSLITHSARVDGGPDQISFSDRAAYIRARDSNAVFVMPLEDLGPDRELVLTTVPVGEQAPGGITSTQALAGAVGSAGRQGAMVIANPVDDQIYYYPEGATAPAGGFQGHSLRPRAVMVMDRSLKEEVPGVYTGRIRIPESGTYLVALMLRDPLLVHCFEFSAQPGEAFEMTRAQPLELTLLEGLEGVKANQPSTLHFQVTDGETGEAIEGVTDIVVLVSQAAGNWNARQVATALEDGRYEVTVSVPQQGLYTLFFAIPSLEVAVDQLPTINLRAALD